ncbi:hypothetical protein NBRC116596_15260 [Litorivita sp. NS0012-18]
MPLAIERRKLAMGTACVIAHNLCNRLRGGGSGPHQGKHILAPKGAGRRALGGRKPCIYMASKHPTPDAKAAGGRSAAQCASFRVTNEY